MEDFKHSLKSPHPPSTPPPPSSSSEDVLSPLIELAAASVIIPISTVSSPSPSPSTPTPTEIKTKLKPIVESYDEPTRTAVKPHNKNEFPAWSLHLTASDKPGVAYQMGALLALHDLSLLPNFRYIHSTGMCNLITACWMSNGWAELCERGIVELNNKSWELLSTIGTLTNPAQRIMQPFVKRVYKPVMEMLKEDQERLVMQWRIFRPHHWLRSWSSGFAEWIRYVPGLNAFPMSLSMWAVDRLNPDPKLSRVPIFTMSGSLLGTARTATWSSDLTVPRINSDPTNQFPHLQSMTFALASDIEEDAEWRHMLAATSIPVESEYDVSVSSTQRSVLEPAYHNDPLCTRALDVYYQNTRGGLDYKLPSNSICMVIDAHSKSFEASKGGLSQDHYNEQCVRWLSERPVELRDPKTNSELQRYALLKHNRGYFCMYRPDKLLSFKWLRDCQKTDIGMCSLDATLAERLANYGYYSIMQNHVASEHFDMIQLPHNDHDSLLNRTTVDLL